MSTLHQLREGLSRALDIITEGWRELVERAGDALTRFHPGQPGAGENEDRITQQGSPWGVLAAEVKINDEAVEIDLEVPGMEAGDFEIRIVDGVLVVHGEKKVQRERRKGQYYVMERAYGAFERAIRLPAPVRESGAQATYERGVLHITLPCSEKPSTRRIEVKSSSL